jgi:hypothetical protein
VLITGIAALAVSAVVVASQAAAEQAGIAACRSTQLLFLRTSVQPFNSVSVGYSLTIRNVSGRSCVLGHLLFVRLPRHAPATIEVKPRLTSAFLPSIDLSRRLIVLPGKDAGTYVIVTAPCGGVHSSVDARIVFGADALPSAIEVPIVIRACRAVPNQVDLPPLANV